MEASGLGLGFAPGMWFWAPIIAVAIIGLIIYAADKWNDWARALGGLALIVIAAQTAWGLAALVFK